ncbi:hypothetical protein EDM57_04995 [Brevibacillus gelatini]|uniref:Treble clef zinc finger domain-containing protein n=1 Tax=Brevibacillus gelatini TaxID=1655277 RepID=A0A3M8B7Z5_9BACL|nr:zinc-ribbon domain-containing protein [Brevibacillus gelatini]RNB59499.1 hypothetical protein EDM57_04995 [Brevibacillus gelatini]
MAILEKIVEVTITPNNIAYYEKLNYIIPKYIDKQGESRYRRGAKIYVNVDHLPKNSHILVHKICDYCNKILKNPQTYQNVIRKRGETGKDCCDECKSIKIVESKSKKVPKGKSLLEKFPEIAKEWHPVKNSKSPDEVYASGSIVASWIGSCGHEWNARINDRTSNNNGCPYCAGQRVYENNCFAILHPELLTEWNYVKNKESPFEYTSKSGKYVWWKCKECDYEWHTSIAHRTMLGQGCPVCKSSKGEKKVVEVLKKHNIFYIPQIRIEDCRDTLPLIFDFVIYYNNELIFIEYDGVQHYKPTTFGGITKEEAKKLLKETQKRDKIKNNYCKENNVKLIRIPYWEYDTIEDVLLRELRINTMENTNIFK